MKRFGDDFAGCRVLAILRGVTPDEALDVCVALYEAGIRFVEVPLNSPDPIASISGIAKAYAGKGMHVGAGTVLDPRDVNKVARAGGTYIVSPNTNPAVIRKTKELRLVSIPGFLTPTEAVTAVKAGADYLKCFPAGALGVGYLKQLKAVIAAPVIATGGIGLENIKEMLGIVAGVGVGSSLYAPGKDLRRIRQDAEGFVLAAKTAGLA